MEKNINTTPAPPPSKLQRTVSIEEPKTLTEAELTSFREAALNVIRTHTPEEATRIFLGKLEITVAPAAKQIEPAARVDN